MSSLSDIFEAIRSDFERRNELRDETLRRSRELIRYCSLSIRATHRREWVEAAQLLETARQTAAQMREALAGYPDLYWVGYTQDALKELAEASIVHALVQGQPLPSPEHLQVEYAAYLNGLGEAMGELRRYILDLIRAGKAAEAEPLLEVMDDVYSQLVTVDYPDAITGGLRRTTDMVRGVLERTRGDLTMAIRQDQMHAALAALERRLNLPSPEEPVYGYEPTPDQSQ
ncbi:MAG: haloacid dehalogenase [Anaerolineae bacterium]|nr:haloacid dehalogenase [Anaerolineae bacterium]MDW8100616.1 haloacid dehalogenase [Anaerolineae bacterium]